jgi:hypothetical protein
VAKQNDFVHFQYSLSWRAMAKNSPITAVDFDGTPDDLCRADLLRWAGNAGQDECKQQMTGDVSSLWRMQRRCKRLHPQGRDSSMGEMLSTSRMDRTAHADQRR